MAGITSHPIVERKAGNEASASRGADAKGEPGTSVAACRSTFVLPERRDAAGTWCPRAVAGSLVVCE